MIDIKIKEVWRKYKQGDWSGCGIAFAAYLNAEAGRRMAEFKLEHVDCQSGPAYDPDGAPCKCEDERHNWTLAEWRAELERELDEN